MNSWCILFVNGRGINIRSGKVHQTTAILNLSTGCITISSAIQVISLISSLHTTPINKVLLSVPKIPKARSMVKWLIVVLK